jgi:geranyl diphosphate synthase
VKCFQGLAYQLVDDALDFTGTQASLGKPALSDLGQGIVTAPILFALKEHPQMYDLIKRKFRKADDVNLVILPPYLESYVCTSCVLYKEVL